MLEYLTSPLTLTLIIVVVLVLLMLKVPRRAKSRPEPPEPMPEPRQIPRDQHPISRKEISQSALKVLHRLRSQGYEAYLVGGCIRDIFLGEHPKDFDVTTNATPEQVHDLFRNSRLIGRRFRLVHVNFGREVIEVATFRAHHNADHSQQQSHLADNGRILRDNVFGSIEEDAERRDFTVNALYYNSADFSVLDFVGGVDDIKERRLRLIGVPSRRYQEDPVRMLRAIRFAAKLDFNIDPDTAAPIRELAPLLKDIPAARLFDETLKLFMHGYGEQTVSLMHDYELFAPLFPATAHAISDGHDNCGDELIRLALQSTDTRIKNERPVTPAFLYACLLWQPLCRCRQDLEEQGIPPVPALQQAAMIVIDNQSNHTAIPKRFAMPMRDIWELQYRLEKRPGRKCQELIQHNRFRAAYDFLLLREQAGESELKEVCEWWSEFIDQQPQEQKQMLNKLPGQSRNNRRRRRYRNSPRRKQSSQ